MGLGLMLGPVLAVFILKFFDYLWTLVTFAVLVGILSFGATFFIPDRIDTVMDGAKETQDVPWKHFFTSPRAISAIMLNIIASLVLIFLDPILVLRLQDLGVSDDNSGLGFALMAFSFTIGSGLSGPLSECLGRRVVMGTAMAMIGIAMSLLSLSNLGLTLTGLAVNGFFVAGVFIPMIPEIMYATELNMQRGIS